MRTALKLWPLLTGLHRYEKVVSTRGRGAGEFIEAPILAYLIETPNGRILYDVGCDYSKVVTPALRAQHFEPMQPLFDVPRMDASQRIPAYLARLGLTVRDIDLVFLGHLHFDHCGGLCDVPGCDASQRIPAYLARLGLTARDIDLVFLGHLHFDHCGGLCDVPGCEVHVQHDELVAARSRLDAGVFDDEIAAANDWRVMRGEYTVTPGVQALATPGHTAGHMSLRIELPHGRPVILCGDAADLQENLDDEVAPGYCWEDNDALALASIRRLKALARADGAELWPNHDLTFFERQARFPAWRD